MVGTMVMIVMMVLMQQCADSVSDRERETDTIQLQLRN